MNIEFEILASDISKSCGTVKFPEGCILRCESSAFHQTLLTFSRHENAGHVVAFSLPRFKHMRSDIARGHY